MNTSHKHIRRALLALAALAAITFVTAGPANASEMIKGSSDFDLGDTHGNSIWDLGMDVHSGSATDPNKRVWSMVMQISWAVYKVQMGAVIWVLNWLLGMEWVQWLLTPLVGFASVTKQLLDTIGLMPLMLTVLGFYGGYWLLKGRYAGGAVELLIGCVISAAAIGFLANPMAIIGGPDGLIFQARDGGMQVATAYATDGTVVTEDKDLMRQAITSTLVDTMIRIPHQMVNYGSVIDGTACESTYDEALKADSPRDKLGECDMAYKDYANSTDAMTALRSMEMLPTVFVFILFSLAPIIVLVISVLGAGWCGIKLLWQMILGVPPGQGRGALFKTFGNLLTATVMIGASTVFLVGWMRLVNIVFISSNGLPWMIRIRMLNVLLVIGFVVLFIARHKVKKAIRKAAARLAAMGPGKSAAGPASSIPAKIGGVAERYVHSKILGGFKGGRKQMTFRGALPQPANRTPAMVKPGASHPSGPATTTTAIPGAKAPLQIGAGTPSDSEAGNPSTGPNGPSTGQRLKQRLGKSAALAAQAAAAYLTAGGSAAATAARGAATGAKVAAAAKAAAAAHKTGSAAKGAQAATKAGQKARAAGRSARNQNLRGAFRTARLQPTQMTREGNLTIDERSGKTFEHGFFRDSTGRAFEVLSSVGGHDAAHKGQPGPSRQHGKAQPAGPRRNNGAIPMPGRPVEQPKTPHPQAMTAAERLAERLAERGRWKKER